MSTPGSQPADGGQVSALRRWGADPVLLLGGVAAVAAVMGVMAASGRPIAWSVPALLGVVAAGLALSGST